MQLRILPSLSLSLLFFSWQSVRAQLAPPDDFFHNGAVYYLSNNIPSALQVVTNGLQQYPDDEKLKKLYELLKQQQQQQNQQNQPDQQQKQDQQKQPEQKQQDQAKNDQPKKDEQQQQQEQPQSGGNKSKDGKKDQESKPVEAHAMTAQEAKQLLDAQKGDEQVLVFQPQEPPKHPERKLKDW